MSLNLINGYKILDALLFLLNLEFEEFIYLYNLKNMDKSLLFENVILDSEINNLTNSKENYLKFKKQIFKNIQETYLEKYLYYPFLILGSYSSIQKL